MFKLRLAAAAAIAGAATLLSAGAAQAYPDGPNVTLTVGDSILVGGNSFSYTADSDGVDCAWTVTYAAGRASGESATQTGNGTSLEGTYKTKVVTDTFKSPIKAVCRYDDTKVVTAKVVTSNTVSPAFFATGASSAIQAAFQNANASATITLLPEGSNGANDDSALPDTGGSHLWILVLGGALVVAGGGITYATRRRHSIR